MNQHNRPHSQPDAEFDLDEYLDQQGNKQSTTPPSEEPDDPSYRYKNLALFLTMTLICALWWFDWSPTAAYAFFTGNNEENTASLAEPTLPSDLPEFRFPEITEPIETTNRENFEQITDYLAALNSAGLLNERLLSAFEARQLYDNQVPISYIEEIHAAGFLHDFSFVHITEYYNQDIPTSYLQRLDEAGLLRHFSFVDVIEFYKNDISLTYLNEMNATGYLDDLSFVHIIEYHNNAIPPDFLDELKEKGLYNSLSFVDVVELYNEER